MGKEAGQQQQEGVSKLTSRPPLAVSVFQTLRSPLKATHNCPRCPQELHLPWRAGQGWTWFLGYSGGLPSHPSSLPLAGPGGQLKFRSQEGWVGGEFPSTGKCPPPKICTTLVFPLGTAFRCFLSFSQMPFASAVKRGVMGCDQGCKADWGDFEWLLAWKGAAGLTLLEASKGC